MKLSQRLRPGIEAAPWVIDEVKKLENELASVQVQEGSSVVDQKLFIERMAALAGLPLSEWRSAYSWAVALKLRTEKAESEVIAFGAQPPLGTTDNRVSYARERAKEIEQLRVSEEINNLRILVEKAEGDRNIVLRKFDMLRKNIAVAVYGPEQSHGKTIIEIESAVRAAVAAQTRVSELEKERDEYYSRAASLVYHLPPDTTCGDVQKWRDEIAKLLADRVELEALKDGRKVLLPISREHAQHMHAVTINYLSCH